MKKGSAADFHSQKDIVGIPERRLFSVNIREQVRIPIGDLPYYIAAA
jgi:hypothetical protein